MPTLPQDQPIITHDKQIKMLRDVHVICLQVIKSSILAMNYSEMMTLGHNEQTHLSLDP
jgi:hypothetical protein